MSKKQRSKRIEIDSQLKKLEQIIKKFEKGEIGLDEGIDEYKKAAKLIKEIKKELTSREVEIKKVSESY